MDDWLPWEEDWDDGELLLEPEEDGLEADELDDDEELEEELDDELLDDCVGGVAQPASASSMVIIARYRISCFSMCMGLVIYFACFLELIEIYTTF